MAMKKASGHWEMELTLECPYCDGWISDDIDEVSMGSSYSGKIKCPQCGKVFIADIRGC